jgi:hypothetical protein
LQRPYNKPNHPSELESATTFLAEGWMEPRARLELATCRLRIGCSTTELPRPLIIKDLLPCQTYFRTTAIKLPSNCHHWSRNQRRDRPAHDRISSARGERPTRIPTDDPHDSLEERPLLFVDYPIGSGRAAEKRNHTRISLSLSHSFRKFLGLQILLLRKR